MSGEYDALSLTDALPVRSMKQLFELASQLEPPWRVVSSDFDIARRRVDLRLGFRRQVASVNSTPWEARPHCGHRIANRRRRGRVALELPVDCDTDRARSPLGGDPSIAWSGAGYVGEVACEQRVGDRPVPATQRVERCR